MRAFNKELIGNTYNFIATVSSSNTDRATGDVKVCLKDIRIIGSKDIVVDHSWVSMDSLTCKINNGKTIAFNARVTKRKRPAKSLYEPMIEDITLTKIRCKG